MESTYKETKKLRAAIIKYVDIMSTEPNSTDMLMTIPDLIDAIKKNK